MLTLEEQGSQAEALAGFDIMGMMSAEGWLFEKLTWQGDEYLRFG